MFLRTDLLVPILRISLLKLRNVLRPVVQLHAVQILKTLSLIRQNYLVPYMLLWTIKYL
jgi:hypothetical protein